MSAKEMETLDSPFSGLLYAHKKFARSKQSTERVDDICKNIWHKKQATQSPVQESSHIDVGERTSAIEETGQEESGSSQGLNSPYSVNSSIPESGHSRGQRIIGLSPAPHSSLAGSPGLNGPLFGRPLAVPVFSACPSPASQNHLYGTATGITPILATWGQDKPVSTSSPVRAPVLTDLRTVYLPSGTTLRPAKASVQRSFLAAQTPTTVPRGVIFQQVSPQPLLLRSTGSLATAQQEVDKSTSSLRPSQGRPQPHFVSLPPYSMPAVTGSNFQSAMASEMQVGSVHTRPLLQGTHAPGQAARTVFQINNRPDSATFTPTMCSAGSVSPVKIFRLSGPSVNFPGNATGTGKSQPVYGQPRARPPVQIIATFRHDTSAQVQQSESVSVAMSESAETAAAVRPTLLPIAQLSKRDAPIYFRTDSNGVRQAVVVRQQSVAAVFRNQQAVAYRPIAPQLDVNSDPTSSFLERVRTVHSVGVPVLKKAKDPMGSETTEARLEMPDGQAELSIGKLNIENVGGVKQRDEQLQQPHLLPSILRTKKTSRAALAALSQSRKPPEGGASKASLRPPAKGPGIEYGKPWRFEATQTKAPQATEPAAAPLQEQPNLPIAFFQRTAKILESLPIVHKKPEPECESPEAPEEDEEMEGDTEEDQQDEKDDGDMSPESGSKKVFRCTWCRKKFSSLAQIKEHECVPRFQCLDCFPLFKIFDSGKELTDHLRRVHEAFKMPCEQCRFVASSKTVLARHLNGKHGPSREMPLDAASAAPLTDAEDDSQDDEQQHQLQLESTAVDTSDDKTIVELPDEIESEAAAELSTDEMVDPLDAITAVPCTDNIPAAPGTDNIAAAPDADSIYAGVTGADSKVEAPGMDSMSAALGTDSMFELEDEILTEELNISQETADLVDEIMCMTPGKASALQHLSPAAESSPLPFTCKVCGKSFYTEVRYKHHSQLCSLAPDVKSEDTKRSACIAIRNHRLAELCRHWSSSSLQEGQKPLCRKCGRVNYKESTIEHHQEICRGTMISQERLPCPHCKKPTRYFDSSLGLQVHIKSQHTFEIRARRYGRKRRVIKT